MDELPVFSMAMVLRDDGSTISTLFSVATARWLLSGDCERARGVPRSSLVFAAAPRRSHSMETRRGGSMSMARSVVIVTKMKWW